MAYVKVKFSSFKLFGVLCSQAFLFIASIKQVIIGSDLFYINFRQKYKNKSKLFKLKWSKTLLVMHLQYRKNNYLDFALRCYQSTLSVDIFLSGCLAKLYSLLVNVNNTVRERC